MQQINETQGRSQGGGGTLGIQSLPNLVAALWESPSKIIYVGRISGGHKPIDALAESLIVGEPKFLLVTGTTGNLIGRREPFVIIATKLWMGAWVILKSGCLSVDAMVFMTLKS